MKQRGLVLVVLCALLAAFFPAGGFVAEAQDPDPGDPIVLGNPNLAPTAQVFAYDVDRFGIYLVQGDMMLPVTSVPVDHVNVDRVVARLSPDALKVAYMVHRGNTGFTELVVASSDGASKQTVFVSEDAEEYISSFVWSHDSQRLAYYLSRDPMALPDEPVTSFVDPTTAIDPENPPPPVDNPVQLTGEVWVTDLAGNERQQIVASGAMEVLGWTGDDTSILYTWFMTDTTSLSARQVSGGAILTETTPYMSGIALIDSTTVSQTVPSDVLVFPNDPAGEVVFGAYLLEAENGAQKLATVSADTAYETMPISGTTLSLVDFSGPGGVRLAGRLSLAPVLTNTGTIAGVSLAPDGTRLAYLTEEEGGVWVAGVDGSAPTEVVTGAVTLDGGIVWGSNSNGVAALSAAGGDLAVHSLGGADVGSLSAAPSPELVAEPLSATDVRNYVVPFIHQLWDTSDWFNGRCACGPTSTTMALAFYGKLAANPMAVSWPSPHTTNYGFYVAEKFGDFQAGSNSVCPLGYGIYGRSMTTNGAYAGGMQAALDKLGLTSNFYWSPTFDAIKAALDKGHLVILSTKMTGPGHIILVRGYTSDGKVVVNDPYGDKFGGTYGKSVIDGENERYPWNQVAPYYYIEVNGTVTSPPGSCNTIITGWKGEYFDNATLAGQPKRICNNDKIQFDWGVGSPYQDIPADNFSVRWTRRMFFEQGVYRFRVRSDDGAQLYVDGRRILNVWWDQPPTNYYADVYLSRDFHTVQLLYYEHGEGAFARLLCERVGTSKHWSGEYYNNADLSGGPTFTRDDTSIYFDWASGGPGNGLGVDNFSVRWNGSVAVPGGPYSFYTRTDDGVRLWVNGQPVIQQWHDQGARTYSWTRTMDAGSAQVRMEYYERGGLAYARMWSQPAFSVRFYPTPWLLLVPCATGTTSEINFDWGTNAPVSGCPRDNFSARWEARQSFSGGRYSFCIRSDDGARVYLDDTRIINRWQDQPPTTYCTTVSVAEGYHKLEMTYYEHSGGAVAGLRWSRLGSTSVQGTIGRDGRAQDPAADEKVLALYADAGYLGPLTNADVGLDSIQVEHRVFLPVIVR